MPKDLSGNLSISRQSDGNGGTASTTYTYDPENRLVAASGEKTATLRYDPFGRLYEVTDAQGGKTRFHYDGDALIGEYNASGTLLQRYVHGPSAGDDPLIRYAGSSTARADARFLYSDRLGSIIREVANTEHLLELIVSVYLASFWGKRCQFYDAKMVRNWVAAFWERPLTELTLSTVLGFIALHASGTGHMRSLPTH